MPKAFAILIHTGQGAGHYDFLLEQTQQASASTWQFTDNPLELMLPGDVNQTKIVGRKIQDHRLMYLDYEGPLSNGRGQVRRLDGGTYEIISQADTKMIFCLSGGAMQGLFTLELTDGHWVLRLCHAGPEAGGCKV